MHVPINVGALIKLMVLEHPLNGLGLSLCILFFQYGDKAASLSVAEQVLLNYNGVSNKKSYFVVMPLLHPSM